MLKYVGCGRLKVVVGELFGRELMVIGCRRFDGPLDFILRTPGTLGIVLNTEGIL